MPDPDDLRGRIADLRRLRDAASPLPWVLFGGPGKWRIGGPFPESGDESGGWEALQYAVAAANLAPALADAYDAALATIAERDAEIRRLKEALADIEQAGHNPADMMADLIGMPDRYELLTCRLAAIAHHALKGANRDDDMTCPKCGGSGGGDDPHLRCSRCNGSGQVKGANRDE